MKNIINLDGTIVQIDETTYPLYLYSEEINQHIQENENLSYQFFKENMRDFNTLKQEIQKDFGLSILPNLINSMGIRNLELSSQGITVNTVGIAQDNASVKLLLETGALRTAVSVSSQLKLKYNNHSDIYNDMINSINNFLVDRGF